MAELETDYLVVGSGVAGLYFALRAAAHGRVLVVTKKEPDETNTAYAQGGVAAVVRSDDSFEKHVADTLVVGDGLCDENIVRITVEEGPGHVLALADLGAQFDRDPNGELQLGREGGHSERRIIHHKDTTGAEVQRALLAAVAQNPQITVLSDHIAIDLLSMEKYGGAPGCFGAYVLNVDSGEVLTVIARATVLASGGAGKTYVYTSNPDVASGDGIAMAYRIGAAVANMEFVQFHPTCLYHPHAKSFLITEAMRGEGGILKRADGDEFMDRYHPDKSLAPRDVVARAIDTEIKKTGSDSVFLDCTHLDAAFLRDRFPNIYERCLALGIDITRHPIPVVPAAHYLCGGVQADEHGRTTIPNLYAIGETSCTGLHGACRLASNSLLEGLVFGARAAAAVEHDKASRPATVEPWRSGDATDSNDAIVVSLNWDEIRRFMWSYVGIVRSDKRIERARHRIELLRQEISEYYWDFKIEPDIIELRNLALVAHLIIESAAKRHESRGLHYTLDYLEKSQAPAVDTVLRRGAGPQA